MKRKKNEKGRKKKGRKGRGEKAAVGAVFIEDFGGLGVFWGFV